VTAVFIASPFFYHVEKKQLPESAGAWYGVCLRLGSDSLLENLSHPGEPVAGLPGEEANDAAPRSGQAVEIWYLRCNNDSNGGQSMTPSEKRSLEGSGYPHSVRVAIRHGRWHRRYDIERFNNTLRQRVARLVRDALSFAKKLANHIGAIKLSICHYNLTRAAA
jgi:hypothetical protein